MFQRNPEANKKITVMLLLPHLDGGGGARRVMAYCRLLDAKKFKVVVAIYHKHVTRDLKAIIGERTPVCISESLEEIVKFARKQKVEVAYTFYDGQFHEDLYAILSSLKKGGIKLIGNNVFSYYDERMDLLFDHVVFQTKMMLEIKFKRNYPTTKRFHKEKYTVLPNPVFAEYFKQYKLSASERRQYRSSLGFDETSVVVGRFGRNDIVKWGDVLFVSMLKLRRDPQVMFLIVGMPRSRRWIIRALQFVQPSLKSHIVVVSPTSDDRKLMSMMQCCDLIGHGVKIGEGCSNAINEAMYWGKPVITNSTPHCDNGQIEQVEDGKIGWIANTSEEWVRAIHWFASSKAKRLMMGERAHQKAVHAYSASQVVQEFEYLILHVLGKPSRPGRIHISGKELLQFRRWYQAFPKNTIPEESLALRLFHAIKRGADYLEFRTFNG